MRVYIDGDGIPRASEERRRNRGHRRRIVVEVRRV